jgi:dTDP-glucose 4,6-dehydratase
MTTCLVTGGAGFIGSNFVLECRRSGMGKVVTLDKLTYAGNMDNLAEVLDDPDHVFVQGDIGDKGLMAQLLDRHQPDAVINFAAESHVDRSILGPQAFIETNVMGTFNLLEASLEYWRKSGRNSAGFRFLHVSTDEVYGSLEPNDPAFTEDSPYRPNSPYSASKAASDHLARSYFHTYGLPVLITNCSNNYGPRQFPEKLIPLMILNARQGKPLPIYGDGQNVRDWLYVDDHCRAILTVLKKGRPGETYNIGGRSELTNNQVMSALCSILDNAVADSPHRPHKNLITYVTDRPGHDRRYAIDCRKIETELKWQPQETFETGLQKTVAWYLENKTWVESVQSGDYLNWIERNYQSR